MRVGNGIGVGDIRLDINDRCAIDQVDASEL
ncbi:Uncharacterised protein [Vibrio cholerae]|nr:Uncharacterised protein [Vibrio cholerae]